MSPLVILLIGAIILLILVAVGVYISSSSERSLVEDRLGKYLDEDKKASNIDQEASGVLSDWVNKRVEKSSWGDRISKNLARADLKFKPGEFIFFILILAGVLGMAAFLFVGSSLPARMLSLAIGAGFGLAGPIIYVRSQQGRRLQKFNEQLSDMLNLVVNGLRAGYSTMQALEAVSRELPPPISDEFRRVVQEMQLGLPMDKALDNLIRRIPSEDQIGRASCRERV